MPTRAHAGRASAERERPPGARVGTDDERPPCRRSDDDAEISSPPAPCRPAPEPLEGLAPVSTLLLDIPAPDASALGRPTPASGHRARLADASGAGLGLPDLAPRPSSASPPAAPILVRLAGPTLASTASTTAAPARPGIGVTAEPTDLHTPSALIARPPGPSAAGQPAGPAAAPVVVSLAPSARPAPTPAGLPSADADGIRPMTLSTSPVGGGSSGSPQAVDPEDLRGTPGGQQGDGVGASLGSGSGSGSGSPTLVISGIYAYGRLNGNPTAPIPWVMQGQMWEGVPALTGSTAYETAPKTYTWSFPAGAVKGYGVFEQRLERPTVSGDQGPYDAFLGPPPGEDSGLYPVKVEARGYVALDDIQYRDSSFEQNDHVFNRFYFGPTTTGTVTVSVTATFRSKVAGTPDFTGTAYVEVNVARPTGDISLDPGNTNVDPATGLNYPPFGTAGVRPVLPGFPQQMLQIDRNTTLVGGPHGIDWMAYVWPTAPGIGTVSGNFAVTQTMTYHSTRSWWAGLNPQYYTQTDGLILPEKQHPGVILDSLHYGGTTPVGYTPLGAVNMQRRSDSPATTLDTAYTDYSRDDSFTMTLMYQPTSPSIWIPVGKMPWSWGGTAERAETSAVFINTGSTQSVGTYSATTTFPTWTHTFKELSNHWVTTSP